MPVAGCRGGGPGKVGRLTGKVVGDNELSGNCCRLPGGIGKVAILRKQGEFREKIERLLPVACCRADSGKVLFLLREVVSANELSAGCRNEVLGWDAFLTGAGLSLGARP